MTLDECRLAAQAAGATLTEAGPRHEAVLRALEVHRGREAGVFLAEGLWLNRQAALYGAETEVLFVCPALLRSAEWQQRAAELMGRCREVFAISEKTYDRVSSEKLDRGMLSIVRLPRWSLADIPTEEPSLLLVLDGLENPGNVGTLLRSADGAGAAAVVLCNRRTGLNNPLTVRSSLCTLLTRPVLEADADELREFLASHGYTIYLGKAEAEARYCEVAYVRRAAIVVGHEKYGVSQSWFDGPHTAVSIPMLGQVDSLNVSVAGSILLYEARRRLGW